MFLQNDAFLLQLCGKSLKLLLCRVKLLLAWGEVAFVRNKIQMLDKLLKCLFKDAGWQLSLPQPYFELFYL